MHAFMPGLPGLAYGDLFTLEGLTRLDQEYLSRLMVHDSARHVQLLEYRNGKHFSPAELSALLLACAPPLDELIGDLFGIRREIEAIQAATLAHNPVFAFKKLFVQRRARRRLINM